jgi:hypothetical protein
MATKIPAIPKPEYDPIRALKAIKETVEVREGIRGDPLDAFVSVRDLRDLIVHDTTVVSLLKVSMSTLIVDGGTW